MDLQLLSRARPSSSIRIGRGAFLAVTFGIAAFLFTGQGISQTRIAGRIAEQAPAAAASDQGMFANSAGLRTGISAPTPQMEEASVAKPAALSSFLMAGMQDGQSSSQSATQSSSQDASTTAAPTKAAAVKTKPPHHGLGIALAAIGTSALVLGVVSFSVAQINVCSNEHGGGCEEARVAGLVLMPAGGAVAVTGFYLQFHR